MFDPDSEGLDAHRRQYEAHPSRARVLLDEALLLDCWGELNRHAASGVHGVTFEAYEDDLYAKLADLVRRLKTTR